MKSILSCTVAALALGMAGSALAADLPARVYTKAPPPVAAVFDWTGFYVGVNGTYLENHTSWDVGPAPFGADGSNRGTGFFGGAQIGYNLQAGNWVFGVEAQGDWGDLSGSHVSVPTTYVDRAKIDSFGLFTGRVGYALNNALFYAKGGAAVVHDKYDLFDPAGFLAPGSASATRWGGAVGGGIEVAFSENWSVAAEYNHAFLDQRTIAFAPVGIGTYNIRQDLDLVSFHLNYRFGGPGVARF